MIFYYMVGRRYAQNLKSYSGQISQYSSKQGLNPQRLIKFNLFMFSNI